MANYHKMKEELNAGAGKSDYLKWKDGENRIRIVSEPLKVFKSFDKTNKETKTFLKEESAASFNSQLDKEGYKERGAKSRFLMYVIERETGLIKQAEFGPQLMNEFLDLATSSVSGFESLPPYDMVVTKSGVGIETEYKLLADRRDTSLTPEENLLVSSLKPISELLQEDSSVVDRA